MNNSTILRNSRREALITAIVWLLAGHYTVGYAAFFAYRRDTTPELLWGIPSWVVWGVVLPWIVCTAVTCWYAMYGIQDEDLGEEVEAPHAAGERVNG